MAVNLRNLLEQYKRNPAQTRDFVVRGFKEKILRPTDFDLGALFAECYGYGAFLECKQNGRLAHDVFRQSLTESAGAVMTNAFQTITQNMLSAVVIEAYEAPEFVITKQIPVRPTKLRTERIPGIAGLGDVREAVKEGETYPLFGVSEEWQDTPVIQKYGFRTAVTREAIFFDQTGILVDRLSKLAYWDAYAQELQAIDCVIDENGGAKSNRVGGHRYRYKDNDIATYGDNSGTHNWDNLQGSNALQDYSDIENSEMLLDAMTDPTTGVVTGAFRMAANQIIVTTQLLHTLKQILHATEVRIHVGGYPTSGNLVDRASANTLDQYQIVTSPLLAVQMATDTSWYVGNIGKACEFVEAWPLETKQAPSNDKDEFERDIAMQFRVSRMGAFHVKQPRYLVKNTVA